MNLIRSRVALRERALLDVLDLALLFCATHARAYARLSSIVLVPAFAMSCVAAWAGGWWLGWATTVVLTAFAGAPFVALASRLVFADDASVGEAIGVALHELPGLAAVRALQAVWLGLSLFLLGLPWLWMGTILLFVVEVLLLERQGGVGAALGRAHRIARARFGPALAAMLLFAAAPIAAAIVVDIAGRELLGGLLQIAPPPSMFHEGGSWLALAGWWATVPLMSTARFLLYLDIRTRSEGWDIQTRFAAIAARAAAQLRQQAIRAPRAALLVLAFLTVPSVAHAAMDPVRAKADVDAAIAESDYSFCREPREPLSLRARSLCGHAAAAGCQGFAAACARAETVPGHGSRKEGSSGLPTIRVPGAVSRIARWVVWLLVAAILGVVLVPALRAMARARLRARGPDSQQTAQVSALVSVPEPPPTSSGSVLLDRADALARGGDTAQALEVYLAAALQALGERGAIQLARHRTNGEYVRSCAEEGARDLLQGIVRDVDRVKFGGEGVSGDAVSRAARGATFLVRALTPVLLALSLALSLGCGGKGGPTARVGDDPAGDELLYDVLRRQGLRVEPLESALASVPLPAVGEPALAVIVDAERTDLDAETRAHLVSWVDAGGSLVIAGAPETWPREFGMAPRFGSGLTVTATRGDPDTPEGGTEQAKLVWGRAIEPPANAESVAWLDDGTTYAAMVPYGEGVVLGLATGELMTNVGLARSRNSGAAVAILSHVSGAEIRVAEEDDGVAPPTTPLAALSRAGLGVGLAHALVASLILFLAVGTRLSRPRPAPPPRSRAFAEHVEAVGALYARAGAASHALASYARFAEERLRARMPRAPRQRRWGYVAGRTDVASFLASQTHLPADVCERLWARATASRAAAAAPLGDELAVLEELSAAYAAATAEDA